MDTLEIDGKWKMTIKGILRVENEPGQDVHITRMGIVGETSNIGEGKNWLELANPDVNVNVTYCVFGDLVNSYPPRDLPESRLSAGHIVART